MSGALFLVVAALTIACALLVILHKSPVYSAIGLVGALGQIAVLFLALDAQIVGFLQIIVYAGAIVVLFLFVIMLLNLQEERAAHACRSPTQRMTAAVSITFASASGRSPFQPSFMSWS